MRLIPFAPAAFAAFTAFAAVMASSACVALREPLTAPSDGGPAWTEVVTPHFVVHTDLSPDAAKTRAKEFEQIYTALFNLAFRSDNPPTERVEVVVFSRTVDFKAVASDQWAAGYTTSVDTDARPRLVFPSLFDSDGHRVFQHELTYRFVRYFMPAAPVWLNEGMASFYESFHVDGDHAVIGQADRRFTRGGASHGDISIDDMPGASALVALKPEDFHLTDERRIKLQYAGSFMLVNMLITGPNDERARFWSFVRALTQGQLADEAWRATFADDAIDDHFREYRRAGVVHVLKLPYQAPPVADDAFAVRTLRDDEVHVLFATLANKKNHIDAAREVERALSEAPQSAEAHYWAGFLRTMHGRERKDDDKDATRDDDKDADQGEAEKELAAAIALSPQEPRYRLALAFAHFEQQMKKQPRDRDLAALSEEVELVSHYDTSVSAQNFTAWFYAKLGDAPRGMPFAVRALDLNPACWECIDTLARLTFLEGKNVDAVALERRAIAAVPDGQAPKGLLAALARYEAAVATAP